MGYPAKVPAFIELNRPGKKRAHITMKGTQKHPLPNVGKPSPPRPKHWTKILASHRQHTRKVTPHG